MNHFCEELPQERRNINAQSSHDAMCDRVFDVNVKGHHRIEPPSTLYSPVLAPNDSNTHSSANKHKQLKGRTFDTQTWR